jgi:hypothetical protein
MLRISLQTLYKMVECVKSMSTTTGTTPLLVTNVQANVMGTRREREI